MESTISYYCRYRYKEWVLGLGYCYWIDVLDERLEREGYSKKSLFVFLLDLKETSFWQMMYKDSVSTMKHSHWNAFNRLHFMKEP